MRMKTTTRMGACMADNQTKAEGGSGRKTLVVTLLAIAALAFFYFVMPSIWEALVTAYYEWRA